MKEEYIHVKYCSELNDLRDFLKFISPIDLITITEKNGYTIIWKSDKEYDIR